MVPGNGPLGSASIAAVSAGGLAGTAPGITGQFVNKSEYATELTVVVLERCVFSELALDCAKRDFLRLPMGGDCTLRQQEAIAQLEQKRQLTKPQRRP